MTDGIDRIQAPAAARRPTGLEGPGDVRSDDFYWLRERDNPEVIDYLEAENAYTAAIMQPGETLQQTLYAEMRGRIKEDDSTVPERIDDYWYYQRTEQERQYPIYCRKYGTLDAQEEILLDVNELAEGHDYTRLGALRVSPNHRLLAYSVDHAGDEHYTAVIKDLVSREMLPDSIPNTTYGLEWAADNATLFYTVLDAAARPYRLYRHRLGSAVSEDILIKEEPDEAYFLSIRKSKSRAFLFIQLGSKITDEIWYLPTEDPDATAQVIQTRQQGVEYQVSHHGQHFYIVTNHEAVDFRLMIAPVDGPGMDNWQEVIPHRPGRRLERAESFQKHLVIYLREKGLRGLRIVDLSRGDARGAPDHMVDFAEEVYSLRAAQNPEYMTNTLRFTYSSLTTPDSVYDYDMDGHSRQLMKQKEILGGYDPDQYVSRRLWARAADGTEIPISLVYKKSFEDAGARAMLLYGYGSYGACIDPSFNANRISLLDRGVTYAIAHVRGGGVMGREWYEKGKFLHKKNTFSDFIDCALHLIDQNYTDPGQLVIQGRSAGGLLMGAVTNMRPDLFRGVIAGVPFVDVMSTMQDPTIPLTVTEYEEWGNPADPEYYTYMKSYSPYDNVSAKAYPHLLVTAGLNDPRVQYWEPAKWVAKLRTLKTDDNLLLLKTNMAAGHGGASGRFDYLEEMAFEYAFMLALLSREIG